MADTVGNVNGLHLNLIALLEQPSNNGNTNIIDEDEDEDEDKDEYECDSTFTKMLVKVKALFKKNPNILRSRDHQGNTVVHNYFYSYNHNPDVKLLREVLKYDSEVLALKGRFGRLPLHYALCRIPGNPFVIKYLLSVYPNAAKQRTAGGWIPLHYAVDKSETSLEVVKILYDYNPTGPRVKDFDGKMAMHWLVDRNTPINMDVLRFLVKVHPDAAITDAMDRIILDGEITMISWNPIDRVMDLQDIESARIMLQGLTSKTRRNHNLSLLFFNLNWGARRTSIMSIVRCSISPKPPVVGKRKRSGQNLSHTENKGKRYVDHHETFIRDMFVKLYTNHFYDLWRVVMSFI